MGRVDADNESHPSTDILPRLFVRELGILAHTHRHHPAWAWDSLLRGGGSIHSGTRSSRPDARSRCCERGWSEPEACCSPRLAQLALHWWKGPMSPGIIPTESLAEAARRAASGTP